MIISDSSVSMSSYEGYSKFGSLRKSDFGFASVAKEMTKPKSTEVSQSGLKPITTPEEFRKTILSFLLDRLKGIMGGGYFHNPYNESYSQPTFQGNQATFVTYEETEFAQFSSKGFAKDSTGRVIEFDIELSMSRTYMEYTSINTNALSNALIDPLVINIDSAFSDVRDQKFTFDLDCDGQKDNISMLGPGSGFLGIDLNDDGIINDGSELFGTKSGNGFSDLRAYDSDNNGWIDEADEVYYKLKVWCKDENGKDILMNLKEADVGAIFLGNASTNFSSYGSLGLNGVVRSTGIFLKESGGVGTIQHVDMAAS